MCRIMTIAGLMLIMGSVSQAQEQVVQQPVIRQLRIGTSVSVPDRGRARLGGVSRGATSTNRYGGPLRSGTSSGREFSNSSMSVSVYIHDFDAMDAALLQAGKTANSETRHPVKMSPRAAHAWRSLNAGYAGRWMP